MKKSTLINCIELADGFAYDDSRKVFYLNGDTYCYFIEIKDWEFYPLLLHRAIQGLNKQWYEWKITEDHIDITRMNPDNHYKAVWDKQWYFKDQQSTETLTLEEVAIEKALIYVLEGV